MTNASPVLMSAILSAQQRRDRWARVPPSSTRIGYGFDDRDWLPHYRVGDAIQDVLHLTRQAEVEAMTREVLDALGVAAVCRGPRPRARDQLWFGAEAIARTDFVAALIWFERLGLAVDPVPWVAWLRPALLRQATVSNSEVSILWYPQEQRRKSIAVYADPEPSGPCSMGEGETAMGYAVRWWLAADGQPQGIEVIAPSPLRCRAAE